MVQVHRLEIVTILFQAEAADINTIGEDVEAELLRGHKKAIIHMSFIEHLNAMVTVDVKGNINIWKYDLWVQGFIFQEHATVFPISLKIIQKTWIKASTDSKETYCF